MLQKQVSVLSDMTRWVMSAFDSNLLGGNPPQAHAWPSSSSATPPRRQTMLPTSLPIQHEPTACPPRRIRRVGSLRCSHVVWAVR